MNLLDIISYIGTFVFAITGALKARAHQMDIFGAMVLAFVTAYGGGTLRDLLIGIKPVNWMNDYLALSLVISAVFIVSLVNKRFIKFRRAIFISDAIGIGLFTAAGIEICLAEGVNSIYAVIMGVVTATFGGFIADILSNDVPDLLKPGELYATACLIGGVFYIFMQKNNVGNETCLISCIIIVVTLRIISKIKRLRLPEI